MHHAHSTHLSEVSIEHNTSVTAMSSEQRKIATDGNAYTWDEFVIYYPDGTQWYWDQAGWPEIGAPSPLRPQERSRRAREEQLRERGRNMERRAVGARETTASLVVIFTLCVQRSTVSPFIAPTPLDMNPLCMNLLYKPLL